jgi:hypothetical protein
MSKNITAELKQYSKRHQIPFTLYIAIDFPEKKQLFGG